MAREEDFFGKLYGARGGDGGEGSPTDNAPRTPVRRRNRRRKGKKFDPRYRQVTAYVRRDVLSLAKHAMNGKTNDRGKDLEFSELVESLLLEYAREEGWTLEDVKGEEATG